MSIRKLMFEDELVFVSSSFGKIKSVNTIAEPHNAKRGIKKFSNYVLVTDNNQVGRLVSATLSGAVADESIASAKVVAFGGCNDDISDYCEYISPVAADSIAPDGKTVYYIIVDCLRADTFDDVAGAMDRVFSAISGDKGARCVVCELLPPMRVIPQGIESLAEREFGYYMENYITDRTPAEDRVVRVESMCRDAVANRDCRVSLLRVPGLFGPGVDRDGDEGMGSIIREAFDNGKVTITDEDSTLCRSYCYTVNVAEMIFHTAYNSKPGNIYNAKSFDLTASDIKYNLYKRFSNELTLDCSLGTTDQVGYACLNNLKFSKICCSTSINEAPYGIQRMACHIADKPLDNEKNVAVYSGKLHRIKSLEMEMLREIDRICRKHDINYFLAGGTMLGAIRYGHSIPWDDDLDLGFLRKDFEKFRKACDEELDSRFVHSCYYNNTKSYYIVDKIRFNDTYFSTNYSSINSYAPDGVFIDLIVYDSTATGKLAAKVHYKLAAKAGRIVQSRWQDKRKDQFKTKLMRYSYPLVRFIPTKVYRTVFEKFITVYKRKKNPVNLLDATGKYCARGTIDAEGLLSLKRVPYDEGFMAPIPEDPSNYLDFAYGPGYINEPPLSKRAAPHNFARIDLGEYVFETNKSSDFRKVDFRGELYE